MPAANLIDPQEPTEAEARQARETARTLSPYVSREETVRIQILDGSQPREVIALPPLAMQLLNRILTELASGNGVAIIPHQADLTTQQAAEFLQVSRPYLIKLLENGEIPFRKMGTHRRIAFPDLLDYKKRSLERGKQALEELAAQAQELGMGY